MLLIRDRKKVFSTHWFDVVAKKVKLSSSAPEEIYYSLRTPEYVSVLGLTSKEEILFISQYRPALEIRTLELPSGEKGKGESAKEAALREFSEETGYEARNLEFLGDLFPDTGRLSSRVSCYFSPICLKLNKSLPEAGIRVIKLSQEKCFKWIRDGRLNNALSVGVFALAIFQSKLSIKKLL